MAVFMEWRDENFAMPFFFPEFHFILPHRLAQHLDMMTEDL